jgi:paraquat-inducible protein A
MNSWLECAACRQVVPASREDPSCPHCENPLPQRRPGSLARSAAFAMAAVIMLVPAYTLPVMSIERLGRAHADTIFNGVWKLWNQGMWGLAIIVFTASLLVPALKLFGLALLIAASRWRGFAGAELLARLHGVLHFIGRWSMLDIFLVAFLCGIVKFGGIASVGVRPGAVAFAAAVILTMLATAAFDPRTIKHAAKAGDPTPSTP